MLRRSHFILPAEPSGGLETLTSVVPDKPTDEEIAQRGGPSAKQCKNDSRTGNFRDTASETSGRVGRAQRTQSSKQSGERTDGGAVAGGVDNIPRAFARLIK
jgi:hypothetical protein